MPSPRRPRGPAAAAAAEPLAHSGPTEQPDPPTPPTPLRGTERLSVNVSQKTAHDVRRIAEKRHTSVTETVRRAIALLALVEDEEDLGRDMQFIDADTGHVRSVSLV